MPAGNTKRLYLNDLRQCLDGTKRAKAPAKVFLILPHWHRALRESRQHDGDGHVVRLGNRVGSPEVYWSRDQSCWIIVDHCGDSPKVWRTPDIALVRFVGDAGCHAGQGVAFASETEGEEGFVYIVPADQPSVFGKLRSLLWQYLSRNL